MKEQTWEERFNLRFPCSHHPAQCDGDCNDSIKGFIKHEMEYAVLVERSRIIDNK